MGLIVASPVFVFIIHNKEAAYIKSPVGHASKPHFDAFRDLAAQSIVSCADISRPEYCPVFLYARISRSGKVYDPFLRDIPSPVFIYSLRMIQAV